MLIRRVVTWRVSDHETAIRQGARVMAALGVLCLMNLVWYGASGLGCFYLALTVWLVTELWRGKLGVAVWSGRFAALALGFVVTAELLSWPRRPLAPTVALLPVAETAIFGLCLGYLAYLLCHPSVTAAWKARQRREPLHWGLWLAIGAVLAGCLHWVSISTPWHLVGEKPAVVLAEAGIGAELEAG